MLRARGAQAFEHGGGGKRAEAQRALAEAHAAAAQQRDGKPDQAAAKKAPARDGPDPRCAGGGCRLGPRQSCLHCAHAKQPGTCADTQ